jgi:hypothetical protein
MNEGRPGAGHSQLTQAVRLPAAIHSAAAGGRAIGHLPDVSRGGPDGAQTPSQTQNHWNPRPDPSGSPRECALVARLRE